MLLLAGCRPLVSPPSAEKQEAGKTPLQIGKDRDNNTALQAGWDRKHLYLRVKGLARLVREMGAMQVAIGVRLPTDRSGAAVPPSLSGDQPVFRWRVLSGNPLPPDNKNSNPNRLYVFQMDAAGTPAKRGRLFISNGPRAAMKAVGLSDATVDAAGPDDVLFTVPWNTGGLPPWFDVLVVAVTEHRPETVLVFPAENGKGPRALVGFTYSFTPLPGAENAYAVINSATQDLSRICIDAAFDAFPGSGWNAFAQPAGTDGVFKEKSSRGHLLLGYKGAGRRGYINTNQVQGTFEVVADVRLLKGAACGLVLYKVQDGEPVQSDFLRLERRNLDDGRRVVRVYAQENGTNILEQWWRKYPPFFEYELGAEEFGQDITGLRVLRDARSGCLRFAYRYDRMVDGEALQGWMEFPTIADRDERAFVPALYVAGESQQPTLAALDGFRAAQLPHDDMIRTPRKFSVVQRPYTFSGVTDDALVISFDPRLSGLDRARFVFWRRANYIPWWHIDNTCAFSYEFVETWDGGTTWQGTEPGGCCEPMSDRLLRWSRVEVVESNAARVIVRWHYVLANPEYQWWGRHPEQRPRVQEDYCFYPDGTGVRTVTYDPVTDSAYDPNWNEIAEPMLVQRGGILPSECLSTTPLTLMNLDGRRFDYTYLAAEPQYIDEETQFWDDTVIRVNLNYRPDVFMSFSQDEQVRDAVFPVTYREWWGRLLNDWHVDRKGGYEYEGDYWPFAHWPVSHIPYEDHTKRNSRYIREPGHTSVLGVPGHPGATEPVTWSMLIGLEKPGAPADSLQRTSSWLYPGEIRVIDGNCRYLGNDYYHRALVFECRGSAHTCRVALVPEPILVNPVFVMRNWGDAVPQVRLNGQPFDPMDMRFAYEGNDLILWLNVRIEDHTDLLITAGPE
jgi:hypothetical protein